MKLVFIHGWGFDRNFWRPLAALLSEHDNHILDLGFFGNPCTSIPDSDDCIMVGHSLGFVHGMTIKQNWAGWIAINSFPNFVQNNDGIGCVAPAALRVMRKQLVKDTNKTLIDFYDLISVEHSTPDDEPVTDALLHGLDQLRNTDIHAALSTNTKPHLVLAAENDPLVHVETSKSMTHHKERLALHSSGGHILPLSAVPW